MMATITVVENTFKRYDREVDEAFEMPAYSLGTKIVLKFGVVHVLSEITEIVFECQKDAFPLGAWRYIYRPEKIIHGDGMLNSQGLPHGYSGHIVRGWMLDDSVFACLESNYEQIKDYWVKYPHS